MGKKPKIKEKKESSATVKNTAGYFDLSYKNQLLIILGFTAIAFFPVLKAEFLNWDDNQYVFDNTLIRSFSNFSQLVTEPLQGNHHPLTMLSLALNYAISGYEPWSYHLLNLLLHLANTFLVYRLALKLSNQNNVIAFTTALLFGIHPMHVESVAWVAERKDVLYSLFFLLGLDKYLQYRINNSRRDYLICILWFALSLLSKPAAVVFPLVLLAIDFLQKRTWSISVITEKIPHFIMALLMGILTYNAQSELGSTETIAEFNPQHRLLFGFYSFMMYMAKFILPLNQTPFYPYPLTTEALPALYYLAPLFALVIGYLCFKTLKTSRVFTFGILFYLINILLIMQFMIVGRAIIAERYTYIPYIGLAFIAGWLIDFLSKKQKLNPNNILLPLGVILSVLTFRYSKQWKNGETLWQHAIEVNPGSRVYHNRASLYRTSGNFEKAIELYTEALKYKDDIIEDAIYTNRGNIYFDAKQYKMAISDYNKSLKIKPGYYQNYENRGASYLMMGNYDSAMFDLLKAAELNPKNLNVYSKLGVLYLRTKKYPEAIETYTKYVAGNPEDNEAVNNLGYSYFSIGNHTEAIKYFNMAISKEQKGNFYMNRSFAYKGLGDLEKARKDALEAQKLGFKVSAGYWKEIGF